MFCVLRAVLALGKDVLCLAWSQLGKVSSTQPLPGLLGFRGDGPSAGGAGQLRRSCLSGRGAGASAQRRAFTWDARLVGASLRKEEYKTECLLLLLSLKRKIMFASIKVRSNNVNRGSPHDIHKVL